MCSGHKETSAHELSTTSKPVYLAVRRSYEAIRFALVYCERRGKSVKQSHVASVGRFKVRDLLYPQARCRAWRYLEAAIPAAPAARHDRIRATMRATIGDPPVIVTAEQLIREMHRAFTAEIERAKASGHEWLALNRTLGLRGGDDDAPCGWNPRTLTPELCFDVRRWYGVPFAYPGLISEDDAAAIAREYEVRSRAELAHLLGGRQ